MECVGPFCVLFFLFLQFNPGYRSYRLDFFAIGKFVVKTPLSHRASTQSDSISANKSRCYIPREVFFFIFFFLEDKTKQNKKNQMYIGCVIHASVKSALHKTLLFHLIRAFCHKHSPCALIV